MRGVEQIPWLYDACCALIERFGLGRWRRWLVEAPAGRTLDIGCGTAATFRSTAPQPGHGSRPSRDALLTARRRAPGVPLVQGDAQALPFRTARSTRSSAGRLLQRAGARARTRRRSGAC